MAPDRFYTAVINILALGLGAIALQLFMLYAHLTSDNAVGVILASLLPIVLFGACAWETRKLRQES